MIFFKEHKILPKPSVNCYLCEYVKRRKNSECTYCPIEWGTDDGRCCVSTQEFESTPYAKWRYIRYFMKKGDRVEHIQEAADLAEQIANLPTKKGQ